MQQYSVDSRTIENVIGYIKDGQISIPEIQRPFVWDGSKIRDLIDSLYNGYPVGYLIVWQNPDVKDKNGNTTLGKKIMIDGQQRVTAIMTAIVGLKVLDKDFKEKVYRIAFNPFAEEGTSCFEVQSAAILKDRKWIPDISVLFKPDFNLFEFVTEFCNQNPEITNSKLGDLITKVQSIRNAPIGIINLSTSLTIDEVTEIFIRINSQGKSLTQADFVMSTIAADETYGGNMLRKAIDYFCHLGQDKTFINQVDKDQDFVNSEYYHIIKWYAQSYSRIYTPIFDDIIRTSFMCKYYRGKLSNFTDLLHGRDFESRGYRLDIMKETIENFAEGAKTFMDRYTLTQFMDCIKSAGFILPKMIRSRMAIDFAYMLFIRLRNDRSVNLLKVNHYVQKWYVMSLLTARYSASPESQFEKDMKALKDKGFVGFYDEVMMNMGDDFWNVTLPQAFETSSNTAPAFIVYMAAQCKLNDDSFLGSGDKIRDLIENSDIHHLFPKQYLIDSGITNTSRYNQVANYAVLSKTVNIVIGKKAPNVYMNEVVQALRSGNKSRYTMLHDENELEANCKMNCIPENFENMTADDYDNFLRERRKLMAQRIHFYFNSL